jgi:competence ComEA-like helix-hairpin-helix protein
MTTIRKWVRFLFGFSGTETNGFLILFPLLFIILFSQPIYRAIKTSSAVAISETDKVLLDSIIQAFEKDENETEMNGATQPKSERHLVVFNPNTASEVTLMQLGFDDKISKRIITYRSKGGKFLIKQDLLKVFGMDTLLYRELHAYIDLPETRSVNSKNKSQSKHDFTAVKRDEKFDLNLADTTELKTVYGVGSKRARRIIAFREKLGGFIRSSQLREVYGLDSAAVEQLLKRSFIADGFLPFRLNINKAGEQELSAHPYISPVIAKAIVAYRFQHGNFASADEIRKLQNLKKEEADKIIPYLDVNL